METAFRYYACVQPGGAATNRTAYCNLHEGGYKFYVRPHEYVNLIFDGHPRLYHIITKDPLKVDEVSTRQLFL